MTTDRTIKRLTLLVVVMFCACAPARMQQRHDRAVEIKTSAECVYQEIFIKYRDGDLSEAQIKSARAAYNRVADAQYQYLRLLEDGAQSPDRAELDTAYDALMDLGREAGLTPEALTCP